MGTARKLARSRKKGGNLALASEGALRYWTTASTTVVARTPYGSFKLFKIIFGEDGSIYLPFPYLDTKRGILSEADPQHEPDPHVLTLSRNGVVVDYDAKFAHHTSGEVHFSLTGKKDILPFVWRRWGSRDLWRCSREARVSPEVSDRQSKVAAATSS